MPTVDQILDNYERAIGGRQAWAGITSRVMKGTLELPQGGASGTFESYEAQPGRIYLLMRFGTGAESKVGWATNSQTGLHNLTGEELVDVKRGAQHLLLNVECHKSVIVFGSKRRGTNQNESTRGPRKRLTRHI
jgi:hypothetical protein